ncbi:hypothetical protein ACTHAM_001353 [Cellulomonas soli]|uniref:hypothetical protein n=1 Tax=Cellulomonas soli TaxID=931535 RepID=UPI003F869757
MNPTLTSVLVPDLPPAPTSTGDGGPVSLAFALIAAGFVIAFTTLVVRTELGLVKARRPLRLAAILIAGMFVFGAAAYIAFEVHVHREERALDVQWELEQAAEATVIAGLEETYGITFTDSMPIIPIRASYAPREEDVRLPDGTETTCWIDIEGDHYALLCGGDTLETSTRLEPVNS